MRGKRYVHPSPGPVEAEAPVDAVVGEMVSLPVDAELTGVDEHDAVAESG